jgi:hypothetical protein
MHGGGTGILCNAACKLSVQFLPLDSFFGGLLLLQEFPIKGLEFLITSKSQLKTHEREESCMQSAKGSKQERQ